MIEAGTAPASAGRTLSVVDSHTCGQSTRVICDGLPELEYDSIAGARDALRADHDWIRRCAVLEPHGHPSLFCAALVAPLDPGCDAAVVFMDAAGYHDMCGHATIGVVTTLIHLGRIAADEGEVGVSLETPLGRIDTRATVRAGRATQVAFVNQPSFQLEVLAIDWRGARHDVPVAFGGQWYAFLDARAAELTIEPASVGELVRAAADVRPLVAEAVSRPDPRTGAPPRVGNIMWYDEPDGGEADGRNMPVNIAGNFDRSPCGTGTSARLAVLNAAGSLAVGDEYVNSGVLGTTYRGRILAETAVGTHPAIVPEITGSAWITGTGQIWLDPTDPLVSGFEL
jgi:proline racemase